MKAEPVHLPNSKRNVRARGTRLVQCVLAGLVALSSAGWAQPVALQATDQAGQLLAVLLTTQDESVAVHLLEEKSEYITVRLWTLLVREGCKKSTNKDAARAMYVLKLAYHTARKLNDTARIAHTYYRLGYVHLLRNDINAATTAYAESRRLFESISAFHDTSYVLSELGSLSVTIGDFELADYYSQESLRMSAMNGPIQSDFGVPRTFPIATAWRNLGAVKLWNGEYADAVVAYKKSLNIWEELTARDNSFQPYRVTCLTSLGIAFRKTGDHNRALNCWQKALELSSKMGDVEGTAGVLGSIGLLHLDQRDYAKASSSFRHSLTLFSQTDNRREIATTLLNIGVLEQRLQRYDEAVSLFESAIVRAREVMATDVEVAALEGLGSANYERGQYDIALHYLDKAQILASRIGDKIRLLEIDWRKGQVYFVKMDAAMALRHAEYAVTLALKLRTPLLTYLSMTLLGKVQKSLNDVNGAKKSFQSAIDSVERMRDNVAGGGREQQLFFEDKLSPYHAMVEIHTDQHEEWRALEYAEMAKARVLFDSLSNGRPLLNGELTEDEVDQEHELYVSMTALNSRLRALRMRDILDQKLSAELEERLSTARRAYEAFEMDMYAAHPRLRVQHGRLEEFSKERSSELFTDRNLAILNYVVTENRTLLFVLTRGTDGPSLEVISIPLQATELSALVRNYQDLLAKNHPGYHEAGRKLYELLVKPAEKLVAEALTICIIPDASLWNLSFQALENPRRQYLIEKYALFYAPSLQVLAQMSRSEKGGSMDLPGDKLKEFYAIANPALGGEALKRVEVERGSTFAPLPEAEREVNTISSQVYGSRASKVRIGKAALEGSIKAEMKDYRVIHFATHGVLDDKNPLYSYLVLAPGVDSNEDGLLEAWELMKMDLKAELAVLSACDTARGRVGLGEGIIGLTWALFVAGVPTTIASQWQVPSEHTTRLMVAFHKARASRKTNPISNAEAWRRSALSLIRNPRFRNKPYYWAGLVVIGNGNHPGATRSARSVSSISSQSSRGSAARRAKSHNFTRS